MIFVLSYYMCNKIVDTPEIVNSEYNMNAIFFEH